MMIMEMVWMLMFDLAASATFRFFLTGRFGQLFGCSGWICVFGSRITDDLCAGPVQPAWCCCLLALPARTTGISSMSITIK
jgi:hypothetical protein